MVFIKLWYLFMVFMVFINLWYLENNIVLSVDSEKSES